MKKLLQSTTVTTGLAIFAMLFGAGNLIFPLKVGIISGSQAPLALASFMLTGVVLPLLGLIGMAFFNGDYKEFFYRIGKVPGKILILLCMLIIGPLLVMPRIVDLTYELMRPFVGNTVSLLMFSLFFAVLTFICGYKRGRIVDILGKVLSPVKLISLSIIIITGILSGTSIISMNVPALDIISTNLKEGYNTLDLLGAIFFAYVIISVLKKNPSSNLAHNPRDLVRIMIYGGIIGGSLLALVYTGMGFLGAYHGQGLAHLDPGKMFIHTILHVMGNNGALFMALTVLVACLSTMIALTAVVGEYLKQDVFKGKLSYPQSLAIILAITILMAQFELGRLLELSEPVIAIVYPLLIVLTLSNIAYKLFDFKYIKLPMAATLILMSLWTTYDVLKSPPLKDIDQQTVIPDATLGL